MKPGKRVAYLLILALLCLSLLIRLPLEGHENGVDSFFIHNLSTTITEEGNAPWILNPLGYFGWYPLSYPGAGPFLISEIAQLSETTEEGAVLWLSLWFGIAGALVAFVMARAFRQDLMFALLVALIFALAPRFMAFTLWTASTRNLFMVLTPVFLWGLVRTYQRPTIPNLFLLFSVLVVMLATHRLTILLAVVVLAFILTYILLMVHRVMRIRFPRILLSPAVRRWTPWLTLGAIFAIAVGMLVGANVLEEYSRGELCRGESTGERLCNLGVSVTRSVGLALPFGIVGILAVARDHNRDFRMGFLVMSMLALIPTLFLRQYTGFYVLPFIAILAAFGITGVLRLFSRKRRIRIAVLAVTVVAITAAGVAILQVEVERTSALSDADYSAALYLRNLPEGNIVTNDGLMGVRLASVSGRSCLPVGGAGTTAQSPELLIMRSISPEEVFERERRIPLTELTIESDSPFLLQGVDSSLDWRENILRRPVTEVSHRIVRQYGLQYYVELDDFRLAHIAWGNIYYYTQFQDSTYRSRYKLYDGNAEDIYLTFAPFAA